MNTLNNKIKEVFYVKDKDIFVIKINSIRSEDYVLPEKIKFTGDKNGRII